MRNVPPARRRVPGWLAAGNHGGIRGQEGWVTAMGDTLFDIHISYRRGDRDLAAALARRLEERGVTTQYDAGIGGARTLAPEAGPEQARMLVILASSEPHDGRDLKRELAAADKLARPVVTLLLEDMEPKGATLQALADRIWVRAHPEPMTRIDEIVELLATLAGKGTPKAAPAPAPETLEGREQSLDAAISELLSDSVDPASRAPADPAAYVGRAGSGGRPAPARGGPMAAAATVATLGVYGAMAKRDALKRFRANARRL